MDCATARHVWNHEGGLLAGLNCRMPRLVEYLSGLVAAFKNNEYDPFDAAVKQKAGDGPYRVTHDDGESQMAQWTHDILGDKVARRELEKILGTLHGIPDLRLAAICCNGCKVSAGEVDDDFALRIQLAAVNTNPDGSDALQP